MSFIRGGVRRTKLEHTPFVALVVTTVVDKQFFSIFNSLRCVQSQLPLGLIIIPVCIWLARMIYAAYIPEHTSNIGPFFRSDVYVICVENSMSCYLAPKIWRL